MKEKIIKLIEQNLSICLEEVSEPDGTEYRSIKGIPKAAEEIIQEINKPCCEKCKYWAQSMCRCGYHHIDISDPEILKCNDFTEINCFQYKTETIK